MAGRRSPPGEEPCGRPLAAPGAVAVAVVALPLLACLALALPEAAAQALASAPAPSRVAVELRYFAFQPNETVIPAGTEVVFVNRQDQAHQLIWQDKPVPSVTLLPGESWTWRFDESGAYTFRCPYDSKGFEEGLMHGRILVTSPAPPEAMGVAAPPTDAGIPWGSLQGLGVFYGPAVVVLLCLLYLLRSKEERPDGGIGEESAVGHPPAWVPGPPAPQAPAPADAPSPAAASLEPLGGSPGVRHASAEPACNLEEPSGPGEAPPPGAAPACPSVEPGAAEPDAADALPATAPSPAAMHGIGWLGWKGEIRWDEPLALELEAPHRPPPAAPPPAAVLPPPILPMGDGAPTLSGDAPAEGLPFSAHAQGRPAATPGAGGPATAVGRDPGQLNRIPIRRRGFAPRVRTATKAEFHAVVSALHRKRIFHGRHAPAHPPHAQPEGPGTDA